MYDLVGVPEGEPGHIYNPLFGLQAATAKRQILDMTAWLSILGKILRVDHYTTTETFKRLSENWDPLYQIIENVVKNIDEPKWGSLSCTEKFIYQLVVTDAQFH